MRDYSKELEALMELTLELLATLSSDSEWTAEEDDKLKRIDKIAAVVVKVKNAIGDSVAEIAKPEEDEKIISRFLARTRNSQ